MSDHSIEQYDSPLRMLVPSRRNPEEKYLVELDSYGTNGKCVCYHFQCRLEPLLRRMVTPTEAFKRGLVKLKPDQKISDALRCRHIIEAREEFLDKIIAAISERENAKHAHQEKTA